MTSVDVLQDEDFIFGKIQRKHHLSKKSIAQEEDMSDERKEKLKRLAEVANYLPDDKIEHTIGYGEAMADMKERAEKAGKE